MFADQVDDPLAAFAAVDRAAEIDRIAQQGHVIGPKQPREDFGEFVSHLAQRAIAVRLEKGDDAAWVRLQGSQGGGALFRVVAEVIDYGYATWAGANDLEPAGKADICPERSNCLGHWHAGCVGRGNRGEGIGQVMPPRHLQVQRVGGSIAAIKYYGAEGRRPFDYGALLDADLGRLAVDPEPDCSLGARGKGKAFGIVGIERGNVGSGQKVAKQDAQLFHRLVIEADVQQH